MFLSSFKAVMRITFISFVVLCVLLEMPSYSAEIIFLGTDEYNQTTEKHQQFTFDQRVKDLFDFSSYPDYDKDRSGRITGRLSTQTEYTNVSGNSAKSFYRDDNVEYQTDLNLNIQQKMFEDYNLEVISLLRKTDNSRVDARKDVRMKQFDMKLMNDKNLFEFGDFYSDFSSFVLSSSLEGLNVEVAPTDSLLMKGVLARSYGPDESANLFQRNVYGLKTDTHLFSDSETFSLFRLGVQGVAADDDSSSIGDNGSAVDLNSSVMSVDTELRMRNGFSFIGELARSNYIADDDAVTKDASYGWALRLNPGYKYKNLINLRYLYYYVQPDFYTELGSASRDKIQHQITADVKLNQKTTLSLMQNWYWDHLEGSTATKRTTYDDKNITLAFRPSEQRRDLSIRAYLRHSDKNSDDFNNSSESTTITYGLAFNDRVWDTIIGSFYELRYFDDKAGVGSTETFHRFGFNFSRDFQVWARRLYLSMSYNNDLRDAKSDSNMDVNTGVSLNGRYEWHENLDINFGHNLQNANNSGPDQDFINHKSFVEFVYLLGGKRRSTVSLRGEINDYDYERLGDDYKEARGVVQFSTNF